MEHEERVRRVAIFISEIGDGMAGTRAVDLSRHIVAASDGFEWCVNHRNQCMCHYFYRSFRAGFEWCLNLRPDCRPLDDRLAPGCIEAGYMTGEGQAKP